MKSIYLLILAAGISNGTLGQSSQSLAKMQPAGDYENIHNQPLYADSLASSFLIWVKKEVKAHKHLFHSEHVYVLEGEGEMRVGNETIQIKPGDIIFIPKNTVHSLKVTSGKAIKALSIQAPRFDGTDRVMVQ